MATCPYENLEGLMESGPLQPFQGGPQMASAEAEAHFLMFKYKIEMCQNPYNHDWAACPYAHPKDRARRRDPLLVTYFSQPCPDKMQGHDCPKGDECPYTHSVAEYWLHPARFRTQYCKQGPSCCRRLCFFAHSPEELRTAGAAAAPPGNGANTPTAAAAAAVPRGPAAHPEPVLGALRVSSAAPAPALVALGGADAAHAGALPMEVVPEDPPAHMCIDPWSAPHGAAEQQQLAPMFVLQPQQEPQPQRDLQQLQQGFAPAIQKDNAEMLHALMQQAARARRASFEERSAMRLSAYLEQQQCVAMLPEGDLLACLAQQQQGVPGAAPPAHRARRSSSASYVSYGAGSLALQDVPELPGAAHLGPLGMPQRSRRTSAASYCGTPCNAAGPGGPLLLPDLPEALIMPAGGEQAAAQQLLPGWALGALPLQARTRRGSAASYLSGASGAADAPQSVGPLGIPQVRTRRGSAASYGSGGMQALFCSGGGGSAAGLLPRSRRMSSTSTASSLSYVTLGALSAEPAAQYSDRALDDHLAMAALPEAGGGVCLVQQGPPVPAGAQQRLLQQQPLQQHQQQQFQQAAQQQFQQQQQPLQQYVVVNGQPPLIVWEQKAARNLGMM